MKNALLFVFGTLMVLFGAITVLLYLKVDDNLLNKDGGLLGRFTDRSSTSPSPMVTKKNFRGQIFIVTRGGESVPLGGVIVSFYTHQQFQELLPSIYQKIGKDVKELLPVFEARDKAANDAHKVVLKLDAKAPFSVFSKAVKGWNKTLEGRISIYNALISKTNAQVYADSLPKPYITAQTAPDGKFILDVSTDDSLVATACASRQLGENAENYCWFITMDGTTEVFMNHHNMFGMRSPDSAIPMPDLPLTCGEYTCSKYVEAIKDAYALFMTANAP
ncbi:hypothetical protein D3C84_244700 [compost metagenome]